MRLELWFMIYWLDPCERLSGGCLSDVTIFLAVIVTVAELHSKTKKHSASWENGEPSLTHKPQRRGVQEPHYKSIETGESDHTLYIRAFLPSFPCRPSPVLWGHGKEEKQTLITIRTPQLSWGHAEWMSARSRGRNPRVAELTHQVVWRKQRLLKELHSAAIRFLYHLCTLISFYWRQVMCKTPSLNDEWRQLGHGWAITLEVS